MRGNLLGIALAMSTTLAAGAGQAEPLTLGAPLGVSWAPMFGLPPHPKTDGALPAVRALGGGFLRVTLYWSQIEPKPGEFRWKELDGLLAQAKAPEELILTLSSASPWATQVPAFVFPSSPAKDPAAYSAFVTAVAAHVAGRVRYLQSDPEPNNPFFWRGTADAFAAQQRLFYAAVKASDPKALVVLGGCDGAFDPTGAHPVPNQQADMDFFRTVIARAPDAFDVFDLRDYGDPYGVEARVAFMRGEMAKADGVKPIIATEYAGPTFFEFTANRRWAGALMNPTTAARTVSEMQAAANLPPETRMFLPDAAGPDADRMIAAAADDLVIRNLLALSAGVQKTAYFDFTHELGEAPPGSDVQFGAFRLFARTPNGFARRPLGEAFARFAARVGDAREVRRIEVPGPPDAYVVQVARAKRAPLWVVWRRPAAVGGTVAATPVAAPWLPRGAKASDLAGAAQTVDVKAKTVTVGASPVFVEG
jgi:hypothetical protein